MIYGIGTDIVDNNRFRSAVDKWGERFLCRVFSERELSYCMPRQNPYPSLAARFAAKEAFIKAFSPAKSVSLSEIEVYNDDNGRPFLRLLGTTENAARNRNIDRMHLSLSHEAEYSIAFVILEAAR